MKPFDFFDFVFLCACQARIKQLQDELVVAVLGAKPVEHLCGFNCWVQGCAWMPLKRG